MFCVNIRQRWIFAILCFLGTLHTYAIRTCLPIALTEMVVPTEPEITYDDSCPSSIPTAKNSTVDGLKYTEARNRLPWSEYTQGMILSAFYYGYIITHIPGGQVAKKYGGKQTLGLGVFISAVLTILIPLAVTYADSTGLMIIRAIMGLGQGIVYPAVSFMVSSWTPLEERSRTGTIIYSGEPLGTIYANTVGGLILFYLEDWRYVFYLIGGTGVVWYILWLFLCYNNPQEHPFISEGEKNYLNERLSEHKHENTPPVPWKHILRSKPLWASIIALMGFDWSLVTMTSYLPKYLSSVLKFSVDTNGYLNSLVCVFMWIGSMITSWIFDFVIAKKYISPTNTRKVGSTIALFCSACFIVAASYAGCDKILVVSMFGVAMGLLGAAYPAIVINTLDLSPNYSGILMAMSNGISASSTGMIAPYVISTLTPNQTLGEWRLVFWIFFIVSVITNIVFLIFGSAEVQYWNNIEIHNSKINKKATENTANVMQNVENTEDFTTTVPEP